jgi:hypothetical protein
MKTHSDVHVVTRAVKSARDSRDRQISQDARGQILVTAPCLRLSFAEDYGFTFWQRWGDWTCTLVSLQISGPVCQTPVIRPSNL